MRYHVMVLRTAVQQAVRDGLLVRNWVGNVARPKKQRKEMRVLDEEQIHLFLAEAKRSSPYHRLYLTALLTGMRQGELLGLRWSDLDLTLNTASIQQTFYRLGGTQLFKTPKTTKARRSIDLPPALVEELRALRDEQALLRKNPRYQDHGLVFCQRNGKPLHAHNVVRRDFHKVLERAKVPQIRFHDLRHSHATLLFAQGEHPKVVQERLGHSTSSMTLDIYSHSVKGMQRDAAIRLGERLLGFPKSDS